MSMYLWAHLGWVGGGGEHVSLGSPRLGGGGGEHVTLGSPRLGGGGGGAGE